MASRSKKASFQTARATTDQKNGFLMRLAEHIKNSQSLILQENDKDIAAAEKKGLADNLIDRLSLHGRLDGLVADILQVVKLPDPVGEEFDPKILPNEIKAVKARTPIGVLGIIYESRPNVTVDVTTLTIKSGNCAILRGGSETIHTNQILVKIIQESLKSSGLPADAIQLVSSLDRGEVLKLLKLREYIDLIIPRGGASLHKLCRENSSIPVITGGIGICHLFVDEGANYIKSIEVVTNAKVQRPSVCNALDTLLVHTKVAGVFIPEVVEHLIAKGVEFKVDQQTWDLLDNTQRQHCVIAKAGDWDTEWLSLVLGIKIVAGLEEAIQHIHQHSSGHSDGILTESQEHANIFIREIDSAAVYVNASTRFTDGSQLGLGSEVAISTQKLHARGPMGLQELTSYKWIVHGDYSVRQ